MKNAYFGKRIRQLQERMTGANVDAFFTLAAPSMRYLTGFTGEEGYLLVLHDGVHLVLDGRFTTQAKEECPGVDVILYAGHFSRSIADLLVTGHAHWLGFEKERVSFVQAEQMRAAFPSVTMVPTENVVEGMRIVKDRRELDKMRKAGAQGTSFSTIVGSGVRGALPHGIASGKVIRRGEVIVIDFGVNYEGYMSDCTRTVALGKQPTGVLDVYAKLRAAQQLGLDCIKAGVSSRSIDTAVRGKLGESGLAQYFTHGLGHGVGLEIHEAPRLSQGTDTVLEPGQVVTCEPGVYLPGRYGMRIEDSVIVTATGFESLTELPKELVLP